MNALILTEGGRGIGLGHVVRCTAVAQALAEAGATVRMVVNADASIADMVARAGGETGDWLSDDALRAGALGECDAALVDSYLAGADVCAETAQAVATAAFFDDDIRLAYPKGLVINGALGAAAMAYPQADGVAYLLGGRYAALRREFWDIDACDTADDIENVMITVGATDIRNLAVELLDALCRQYPQWRKRVIVGAAFENVAEIESCADERTELVRSPDAAAMRGIMLASDIAVSACGQTLGELARTATPTIGVLVADNQRINADGWRRCGFLEYAGDWNHARLRDRILSAVEALMPRRVRAERSRAGRQNADGQGARRIARRMIAGATANEKDA